MFNKLHTVIGCEISFKQAIAFLSNFGFIAEISITTEFLEESHPWSEEETRMFIVPSQLPEGKEEKKLTFIKDKHVWSIYFTFMDGFIPLTIFHQMIAACINWNESRRQNIVWLHKYEIMMVLNHDQYYSVNLCEEKSSIQVDIILGSSMKKSAENRKELIDFFQAMLEKICHDLIPASSKPIPHIQCPHCDKVHLKLRNALEGRTMLCSMKPIRQDYYQDLFTDSQGMVSNRGEQHREVNKDVGLVEPSYQNLLPYFEHVDNWKSLGGYLLPEEYTPRLLNDIEQSELRNAVQL